MCSAVVDKGSKGVSGCEGWSFKFRGVEAVSFTGYFPRFRMACFVTFLDRNYYRLDRKYC